MIKVNLECGNNLLMGYKNITSKPINTENIPMNMEVFYALPHKLEDVFDKADEILFNPPINCLPYKDLPNALNYWKSKLNPGGALKLVYFDIRNISRSLYKEELNLMDAHQLLFGPNNELKTVIDYNTLDNIAKNLQMKIDKFEIDTYVGYIELKLL